MNGPRHYQAAETWLREAEVLSRDPYADAANVQALAQIALVHAVLGLTAAVAELEDDRSGEVPRLSRAMHHTDAWLEVLYPPVREARGAE